MRYTLLQDIASTVDAYKRCRENPEQYGEWEARHLEAIRGFERNELPSGSGIDSGTKIDIERCTPYRVVLTAGFHHMNKDGMYDGWTEHTITVTPSFSGMDITISGRNRNDIKEYLHDVFYWTLAAVRDVFGNYHDAMTTQHVIVDDPGSYI